MSGIAKCRICVVSGDDVGEVTMLIDEGTLGEVSETYLFYKDFYDSLGAVVLETLDPATEEWSTYRVLN
jgi:hypothetical protein